MLKASDYLTCPTLSAAPNVRHGFFTRSGGASSGIYASLNCGPGSGDDMAHITANRQSVQETLGGHTLLTCYQIHSPMVVLVEKPWEQKDAPQADALVTRLPGVVLGILTADCLPILFADSKQRVIGAAHAGWKGAFHGVVETTVAAMEKLGAKRSDIVATIGPGIAQASYEVGEEFRARFLEETPDNARYFIPSQRNGHFMFDLKSYTKDRLSKLSLAAINLLERDTCLEEDAFFSFRRATLRGEPSYGRQISAIMLGK